VDNTELALRPGMTATAEITVEHVGDVLLVPNAAFRYAPATEDTASSGSGLIGLLLPRPPGGGASSAPPAEGTRTIWLLRDGMPTSVAVEAGPSDGNRTAIVGGDVTEGDVVIVGAKSGS
jgi:HlyD family secretion protein